MPIDNYSVVQPSTQQKTFRENNICRFSIPFNSIPFFDPHSSYLQLLAETTGTNKFELNGNSSVLIKYIRISCNGIVLEEIDEFNQLAHLYNHYGNDMSSREHESVFTMDSGVSHTTGLMGDQAGAVGTDITNGLKKVKLIIPMKECGIFSSLEIVPLMAFGENLDVEIRFAPDHEVLKTYVRNAIVKDKVVLHKRTEIAIDEATTAGGAIPTTFTMTLPYKGNTSIGDLPLQIGSYVGLYVADTGLEVAGGQGNAQVTAIERTPTTALTDNPNLITITTSAWGAVSTNANAVNTLYLQQNKTTANTYIAQGEITYSNVEWYLQKVIPPSQYVKSLKKQLQSAQGFQYDIHTWTTYKSSLLTAVQQQTIEIPAYQSRAKSVICVPRLANQAIVLNVDNDLPAPHATTKPHYIFDGAFQNLKDYQFQVNNGLRVPTRPVNLAVMTGLFRHLSAEHLIQLTQSLGSSNVGVRSIKGARDNFVIGRQLSKYGGTTNLNSAMRIYLNFNSNLDPLAKIQPITFVNHINRVSVNTNGLQVFN